MNLILLGAPGAGKGTQAEVICKKLHIPAISTGNLLREAIKHDTPLGQQAKVFMDKGELVPDKLVIDMLSQRLGREDCRGGYILDGFPRTLSQAEALYTLNIHVDRVIDIQVSDEAITARLSGRRVCEVCGASYHMEYKRPNKEGICDSCGGNVVQRLDDQPDTVLARLEVYHRQTEPLKQYYRDKGVLYTVEGQEEVAQTSALTLKAISL